MAVDTADRFWPGVTRLVVAILIVLLILAVIGMYQVQNVARRRQVQG